MPKKPSKPKVYKFASLDHADTSAMSFEELQNYCLQLFEQVEIEKKEVEKYQIERDKLLQYWNYSGDSLREALYDLRDQQLCLENDEYSMKTRMDHKVQEVRRLRSDASATIEETLVRRCAELARQHEVTIEKNRQVWSDVQDLKSQIVDTQILQSESLTDRSYVKQNVMELISKNMLAQRKLDLSKLRKELRKERKKFFASNAEKFRQEIRLKRDLMKDVIRKNNCSLKKLISSFERILNYNFEKVSDLKNQAESLKKLDIMLSKEYSEANKAFYKSVSSQAEGMRTLNQMRTFLYAAGKTERSLVTKKKELVSNKLQAEALSTKTLNSEFRIQKLESSIKELTDTIVSYRRIMTEMFREDSDILSRNLEKSLMDLFQNKVELYSLISPDIAINMKWETADIGDLTYRTENLGNILTLLRDLKTACSTVAAIYKRLFKLWRIDYNSLGIVPREIYKEVPPQYRVGCSGIRFYKKW